MDIGFIKSRLIYDYKPFIGRRMRNFYAMFIRPGDVCFDIGAHTGNRANTWARMGANVIAVEPQPVFVEFMTKRFRNLNNIQILAAAVGSTSNKAFLHISTGHPTLSTLSGEWMGTIKDFQPAVHFNQKIQVEVITLDEMITKYGIPAFCKIDVEGFEEEVLKGLSTVVPALSFEFFPTTAARTIQCIRLVNNLASYKFNWSFTESFKYNSPEWLDADAMETAVIAYRGKKSGDIYAIKAVSK